MKNAKPFLLLALSILFLTSPISARAGDIAEGHAYFLQYCASCHGANADGVGPAASDLKMRPPDLRRLTEKYGSPLPPAQLSRFIYGPGMASAHVSREIPIWGQRFADVRSAGQSGLGGMKGRVAKIISYLNSIQLAGKPAAATEPSPSAEKSFPLERPRPNSSP
jgi:hypothetical protein